MFSTEEKQKIQDGMKEAQKNPCVLCGKPSAIGNIFLPAQGTRQGRIVIYGLCQKCFRSPGGCERAEAQILRDE